MGRDCHKLERLISDRLDGTISPADESAVQAHLKRCEECRRFEEYAIRSRDRLHNLPDAAIDTPTVSLLRRVESANGFWVKRISLRMPVAAALAFLMLTGWALALIPDRSPTDTSSIRPTLVRSVEIIKAQPALAKSVQPDHENREKKGEDEI